jgi:hypothetical protein
MEDQRLLILEAAVTGLQAQVRELQAAVNGLMVERKQPQISQDIMAALSRSFAIVPEAVAITELTAKEIAETLRAGGLRLSGTPHAQAIALARAIVAFGAVPARNAQGRFYRGIVRKRA